MSNSDMNSMIEALKRTIERERKAKRYAESLLEGKTRELYESNQSIQEQLNQLNRTHKELKVAKNKLVESEKLASLGIMTAGIAHEINNPIGYVLANVTTMKDYVFSIKKLFQGVTELLEECPNEEIKSQLHEQLKKIKKEEDFDYLIEDISSLVNETIDGANRVKEIVHGLKVFSHMDESETQEVQINDCIDSTLKVVWNELKYKVEVHRSLGELETVECNTSQINQVLMNLFVNAGHAIEKKGNLWIETKMENGEILISVRDDGSGISKEHLKEIFNPFFTTKEVGSGTGLGLSISHGIIQKYGGTIEVESKEGEGTCFKIRLPSSQ
ncbi:MAG: histidine kinase [Bdellovibrionaceae bacterium]|nr:histidine kinase [Pseudobdellovibrionaceae bacterium]